MEILSAEQIRKWDEYTIQHEPVASIDLMERAANKCLEWLRKRSLLDKSYSIFCGKGNNGGDGLAIARLLSAEGCRVSVAILEFGHKGTEDFQLNLARLHDTSVEIRFVQSEGNFYPITPQDIVIDALLGSGLNRPLEGVTANLVEYINRSGNTIVSIDIPSGLFSDNDSGDNVIICATYTLSFQTYKLALLMPQNATFVGEVHVLDIGLHPGFAQVFQSKMILTDKKNMHSAFKPRKPFAHKGNFGHALLIAGSYGKMGAAVLASRACLRAGVGLLTCHIPKCGYYILQTAVPEAMASVDGDDWVSTALEGELSGYSVIGLGPGLGTDRRTVDCIKSVIGRYQRPIVADADALNIFSSNSILLNMLTPYSILTPHPKEFERLFGKTGNDFERMRLALTKAVELNCIIVLKGHYTMTALPDGSSYFNATGNAGMAKGGSGDALTGVITSLVSQGYAPAVAAVLGVYVHGLAGDIAASFFSEQSMLPSDLIDTLGQAFASLQK